MHIHMYTSPPSVEHVYKLNHYDLLMSRKQHLDHSSAQVSQSAPTKAQFMWIIFYPQLNLSDFFFLSGFAFN